jgi:hypothetical protein
MVMTPYSGRLRRRDIYITVIIAVPIERNTPVVMSYFDGT